MFVSTAYLPAKIRLTILGFTADASHPTSLLLLLLLKYRLFDHIVRK